MPTVLLVATLLLVPSTVRAGDETFERLLVIDMIADEVEGVIARSASTELALVARQVLVGTEVFDQEDIRRILQTEAERMLLGCEDDAMCLAELGGAMGASHIATGTIRKIGGLYDLDMRLIDSARAMNLRHVRERGIDDPNRLIDAVAILGAHLFDPDLPADGGFLDIRGSGQVILDGVFIGSAPLRRVRVASGNRRVIWQAETRTEATVVVEPFTTHRVDPSMGRAVRPGASPPPPRGAPPAASHPPPRGAPPARPPPRPHPAQDPHVVAGDFGGWRLSSGIGSASIFGFPTAISISSVAFSLDVGFTTTSGWDFGFRHRAIAGGSAPENVGLNTTGLGIGYVMGRDLRFRIATHLGGGRWSVYDGGSDDGLVSRARAQALHGRRGVSWDLGVDLRYAAARYFELGFDTGLATVSVPGEGTLTSVHALLIWGVPADYGLYHGPAVYRQNRNFWLTAGLVTVGGVVTLLAGVYNIHPG